MTAGLSTGAGLTADPDLWLTGILGRPALRLARADVPSNEWKSRLKSDDLFVTAKLPADRTADMDLLQDLGFRNINAALTFEAARIATAAADPRVRFARPDDRAAITRLAGHCFVFSRFHLDPTIPKSLADTVKASWAANFFTGQRGDGMVMAEQDGRVAGFLQLLWAGSVLVIDLIAVAPQAARQGLARAMIGFAAAKGTGDGRQPSGFRVGTQAANVPSVRLYESLGFRFTQAQFVLHHHGRSGSYPAGNAS